MNGFSYQDIIGFFSKPSFALVATNTLGFLILAVGGMRLLRLILAKRPPRPETREVYLEYRGHYSVAKAFKSEAGWFVQISTNNYLIIHEDGARSDGGKWLPKSGWGKPEGGNLATREA